MLRKIKSLVRILCCVSYTRKHIRNSKRLSSLSGRLFVRLKVLCWGVMSLFFVIFLDSDIQDYLNNISLARLNNAFLYLRRRLSPNKTPVKVTICQGKYDMWEISPAQSSLGSGSGQNSVFRMTFHRGMLSVWVSVNRLITIMSLWGSVISGSTDGVRKEDNNAYKQFLLHSKLQLLNNFDDITYFNN